MTRNVDHLLSVGDLSDAVYVASNIYDATDALFIHPSQATTDCALLCRTIQHCTLMLAVAILAIKGRAKK